MIELTRSPEPDVLAENADEWTEELLERIDQNGEYPSEWARRRYGRREIKSALVEEANEKCIYCESKVRQVYAGDIEHIQPKSVFPELTFEWTNLAFACQECNRRKHNAWPEPYHIVNPFEDDPSTYLDAIGAFIKSHPGEARGEITVGLFELNRTQLLERRGEKIEDLHRLASRIAEVDDTDRRELLRRELRRLIADSSAYAFVGRTYIEQVRQTVEA